MNVNIDTKIKRGNKLILKLNFWVNIATGLWVYSLLKKSSVLKYVQTTYKEYIRTIAATHNK